MSSAYIGKYFEAHLYNQYEGWFTGICKCIKTENKDGVTLFTMVDRYNNNYQFTAANIIRPVVMKNTPKYKVGDLVYADVSFQAGFSYDCQVDCQITEVKVSFDEIIYHAVLDDRNGNVTLYEKDVIRLASAKPPKPSREEQLAALRDHEQMLLSQLKAVRGHMGSI
jgi:hypothetical protein